MMVIAKWAIDAMAAGKTLRAAATEAIENYDGCLFRRC